MTRRTFPRRLVIENVKCRPYGRAETMKDGTWQTYVAVDEATHREIYEVELQTRRILQTYPGFREVEAGK